MLIYANSQKKLAFFDKCMWTKMATEYSVCALNQEF